jgi:hypothetical protein
LGTDEYSGGYMRMRKRKLMNNEPVKKLTEF